MKTVTTALAIALAVVTGAGTHLAAASDAPRVYVLTAQADSVVRTPHSLFDGSILVPGTSAHDRFAVQNGSGGVAYLRVALTSVDVPDDDLRRSLSLGVSTERGSGPVVPLDGPGPCVTLLAPQPVATGATVHVDAALALGDLIGTVGQSEPIGFSLLVVLDADPAGAGCDTRPPDGGGDTRPPGSAERERPDPLAATGSDILAAVWAAAALGVAGAAAVLVARVRRATRRRSRNAPRDEG